MRDSHFREVNVASLHVNPVEQENRPAILKNHLGTGEAGCAAGGSAAGYTYTVILCAARFGTEENFQINHVWPHFLLSGLV